MHAVIASSPGVGIGHVTTDSLSYMYDHLDVSQCHVQFTCHVRKYAAIPYHSLLHHLVEDVFGLHWPQLTWYPHPTHSV